MADGNTTDTTNGKTEKKTRIAMLIEQHKANQANGVKVDKKVAKELLDEFKKGQGVVAKLEAELAEARKKANANAEAMIIAFGDKKLALNDRIFFPTSRGEQVFYRELAKQDEESLIRI